MYNNNLYEKIGANKPIVLVGMMGAGKTTIGFRLAKKLGVPFLDTDSMVSQMVGCSITDIFKYQSENEFTTGIKILRQFYPAGSVVFLAEYLLILLI